LPTVRTVASLAGVSRQTVSNVLNFPERVGPKLQERVHAAIEELGYRPSAIARSLALQSTGLIAYRVGKSRGYEDQSLDPFMRELSRIGKDHHYRLVLQYAAEDDSSQITEYEDLYARRAMDAVVITESHPLDARVDWLKAHEVPFVAYGRPWGDPQPSHSWVDLDVEAGQRAATEHLIANGHRRIAYLGLPLDGARASAHRDGWAQAMGRLVPEQPLAGLEYLGSAEETSGLVARALEDAGATGFVCNHDGYADAALHALWAAGRTPGRDVAVVGFGNSRRARRAYPPLSSITQSVEHIAELVWSSLLDQLGGTGAPPLQELLAPDLAIRESSDFVLPS
jgi:DNA-binding LacI/PurR family transcriptional regulator